MLLLLYLMGRRRVLRNVTTAWWGWRLPLHVTCYEWSSSSMDAFGPDHIRVKCTYQQHAKSHQIFIASPQIDFDVEWVDFDMSLLEWWWKMTLQCVSSSYGSCLDFIWRYFATMKGFHTFNFRSDIDVITYRARSLRRKWDIRKLRV